MYCLVSWSSGFRHRKQLYSSNSDQSTQAALHFRFDHLIVTYNKFIIYCYDGISSRLQKPPRHTEVLKRGTPRLIARGPGRGPISPIPKAGSVSTIVHTSRQYERCSLDTNNCQTIRTSYGTPCRLNGETQCKCK